MKTLWIAVQNPETVKSVAARLQEFLKVIQSQELTGDPEHFPENRATDSYAAITAKFGDDITLPKLLGIAYLCAEVGKMASLPFAIFLVIHDLSFHSLSFI
jgi:hypothetical protein